jgi:hypothetical protein
MIPSEIQGLGNLTLGGSEACPDTASSVDPVGKVIFGFLGSIWLVGLQGWRTFANVACLDVFVLTFSNVADRVVTDLV